MNDASARQMIREVPPCPSGPREALNLDAGRLCLGGIFARRCGQFLELQLHLIDEPLAALGARAEHLALHLGDYQLKMLDHRLGAGQPRTRLDQRRLQRIFVIGKRIGSRSHAQHCSTIALIRGVKSDALSQRVTAQASAKYRQARASTA
jgi:hypothetical protein